MDGFCYRYDLFFGPHRIGTVIQSRVDSSCLSGTIAYDPTLANPHSAEFARLVEFIRVSELISLDPEFYLPMQGFNDIVASEDWHLVDEQGRWAPISCPFLCSGDWIIWGWASVPEKAGSPNMESESSLERGSTTFDRLR